MVKKEESKEEFLTYKGKPFVRSGNTIYYGSMADDYVVKMSIKSQKEIDGMVMTSKVLVQLVSMDVSLDPLKRIIKSAEKEGLYDAIDIAIAWLEKVLLKEEMVD